jgi:hypothetical protein
VLDAVHGWPGGVFNAVLELLHFFGMPDRAHVPEERLVAELHGRAAVPERAGDHEEHEKPDHP